MSGDAGRRRDRAWRGSWRRWAAETLAEATGRRLRADPDEPRTGGPAGNARLTAWTGLVLLVLFLAEIVTLLDLEDLISWHIAVGALLVPPALVKTATTGWRILRYYTGRPTYRQAGPPPMPLRVLGPVVVGSTLGLLGTGLALVAVGSQAATNPLLVLGGQEIDFLALHKVATAVWVVATGLHTVDRIVPALRITGISGHATRLAGRKARIVILSLTLAVAALTAVLLHLVPYS
ncbi:hypothetical protein PWY87_17285 [Kribbella solani]|uniref:hypothetical protein n=1 Tax=Kribbella solani TaxID=236067 RepID=UPI0029AA1449|nr:hypothetical protein [Kribbella solani]MDX2968578.1 hypothetical protein [Kribbella solani]MDX3003444.1 hypothetical protein [Kribbella solani]